MENEMIINKLRKELLITRIVSIVSCVLMFMLLVGGFLLYQKTVAYEKQLNEYVIQVEKHSEEIASALEQFSILDGEVLNATMAEALVVMQTVDWKMLNETIAQIDWKTLSENMADVDWKMLSESMAQVDWEEMSNQLAALDVEAINKAVEGMDTAELTQSLNNMNTAIDKLRGISESLSALGNKFGFGKKEE